MNFKLVNDYIFVKDFEDDQPKSATGLIINSTIRTYIKSEVIQSADPIVKEGDIIYRKKAMAEATAFEEGFVIKRGDIIAICG